MDIIDMTTNFWVNLRNSAILIPHIFKELDRKYNIKSKIRKLKETDPDLPESLTGKVCVITGGTRGLGVEVVKVLLRKNCYVITGSSAKSESEHKKRYDKIRSEVPEDKGKLEIWHLDLKSMDSVVEFVKRFKESKLQINYLIANAGIMNPASMLTPDGFEDHFQTNYLSHCLLIDHFIDNLYETGKRSGVESRIVLVSSFMHKMANIKFDDLHLQRTQSAFYYAYSMSKLAMLMFSNRMARWLEDKKQDWSQFITINCVNPGICNTEIMSNIPMVDSIRPLATNAFRSTKEGSETIIYASLSTELFGVSGKYLEDSEIEQQSSYALNVEEQNKLWDVTWNLIDQWTLHNWA